MVVNQPDFQGPGELVGPEHLQAEANSGPIPDGEMPGVDPTPDQRRHTLEMEPVTMLEPEDSPESGEQDPIRRTSVERDALPTVRARVAATERRLDHSAGDNQRETIFDRVHDDAGPQSDQG